MIERRSPLIFWGHRLIFKGELLVSALVRDEQFRAISGGRGMARPAVLEDGFGRGG